MTAETQAEQAQRATASDDATSQPRNVLTNSRESATPADHPLDDNFAKSARVAEGLRSELQMARREARSDLDRSRTELIGLIEQVRAERADGFHVPGSALGPQTAATNDRISTIERRLETIEQSMNRCFERQTELAATMEALLDTVLRERRGEPVSGLRLT